MKIIFDGSEKSVLETIDNPSNNHRKAIKQILTACEKAIINGYRENPSQEAREYAEFVLREIQIYLYTQYKENTKENMNKYRAGKLTKEATKETINIFINKIKEKYPDLDIFVDYDEEVNEYDIWHTDAKLQFGDSNFCKFVGGLMQEYLFSNGIYNFSFGYDHMKAYVRSMKEESICRNI